MTIEITTSRVPISEQETHLYYDPVENTWMAETSVQKHITRFKNRNWEMVRALYFESTDGPVVSALFKAPANAVSFRDTAANRKNREWSDEERAAAADRMRKALEAKKSKMVS